MVLPRTPKQCDIKVKSLRKQLAAMIDRKKKLVVAEKKALAKEKAMLAKKKKKK